MHVLVYVPLAAPLAASVAARPLAQRLPPRTATWLLAGSAVALAAASCTVLGLLAFAAAMHIPPVAALGGMSVRAVRHIDPAPVPAGVVAGLLLAAAVLATARAAWLRTRALLTARRRALLLAGPGKPSVIVAGAGADAYTVPGRPSRIVVTGGMLAALTPAELGVLLAHERAHADCCHYLFTAAARLAAAANPLLRPLAAAVDYSIERWADERAATAAGSRPLAARAVARAALAAAAAPGTAHDRPDALPGAVPAGQPLASGGPVPRRVAALMAPPPRRRVVLVALGLALVAAAGLAALDAASDLHGLIEIAQSLSARTTPTG